MEVDRRRLGELVLDGHTHVIARRYTNLRARNHTIEGPGEHTMAFGDLPHDLLRRHREVLRAVGVSDILRRLIPVLRGGVWHVAARGGHAAHLMRPIAGRSRRAEAHAEEGVRYQAQRHQRGDRANPKWAEQPPLP